jgi:hypothetical protein
MAAAVCSVAATIATQLLKSRNLEEHIVRAQEVLARLEIIEVSISAGQLNNKQAASEYKKCIEDAAFIYEATKAGGSGHDA